MLFSSLSVFVRFCLYLCVFQRHLQGKRQMGFLLIRGIGVRDTNTDQVALIRRYAQAITSDFTDSS